MSPTVAKRPIDTTPKRIENAKPNRCHRMKSIFGTRRMTMSGLITVVTHSGISLGFQRRSQLTIWSRVTSMAENSEVKTPIDKVTANPLIGPDPSQ